MAHYTTSYVAFWLKFIYFKASLPQEIWFLDNKRNFIVKGFFLNGLIQEDNNPLFFASKASLPRDSNVNFLFKQNTWWALAASEVHSERDRKCKKNCCKKSRGINFTEINEC